MFTTKGIITRALTQQIILTKVSEYDLWRYYLGDVGINKVFKSPLREDKHPSAVLFGADDGKILMKDFGLNEVFTIFNFLKAKFNLNYFQVLDKIDKDFNLQLKHKSASNLEQPLITKINPSLQRQYSKIFIKSKKYTTEELNYWKDYGISEDTLKLYKVYSLKCFWIVKNQDINQYCNNGKDFIFCYDLGNNKFKVYRPLNFNYKFTTNADFNTIQGISQLPESGDLLIITKALKDVMVLHELGYNAVAIQSENTFPSKEVIQELKSRFKKCIVIFDNDKPGQEAALKFKERFKIDFFSLSKTKDLADYAKKYGKEQLKELLQWL